MNQSVPVFKGLKRVVLIILIFSYIPGNAQNRQINHQFQSWVSINSTIHLNNKFSIIADAHARRTHFAEKNNFYLLRGALQYHFDKSLSVATGYAHMWLYPSTPGWKTVSNEHRIYQQVIFLSKYKNVSIMQRIRNEQRWQQKISNDKFSGDYRFSDRIRYLLSFTIPLFKNKNLPALSVSDEISIQTGKEVVYNTFDQNRLFVGIKQRLTKSLSFDTGYMIVYQQKNAGTIYDLNNTIRLFFYYTPDLGKK